MPSIFRVKLPRTCAVGIIGFATCFALASMFCASLVYAKPLNTAMTPSRHLIGIAEEKSFFEDIGVDIVRRSIYAVTYKW